MAMLVAKCINRSEKYVTIPKAVSLGSQIREFYGSSRIGTRDWVGYGRNGRACYMDDTIFPFPSIRFRENTMDILSLREREKGDWRCLSCSEKKSLYRASFNQTFAEFQHPTGEWKPILGITLILVSVAFWLEIYYNYYVAEPFPSSLSESSRKAQLRRMLDLHVNPVDGISSKWDYEKDMWKSDVKPASKSHDIKVLC